MSMIRTFVNAWKVAELRKKILFTALIVLIFRVGCAIPVPFIEPGGLTTTASYSAYSDTFVQYLNMMTGEAFSMGTVFALSISPYINASIIIQLLTVAIPYLEKLSKDGEEGRKKINKITRYTTVALAAMQSIAYYIYLRHMDVIVKNPDGVNYTGIKTVLIGAVVVLVLTAGSTFIMWLGEQVNDHGIGNGISIILFAGIVARIPTIGTNIANYFMAAAGRTTMTDVDEAHAKAYWVLAPILIIGMLAMIAYIVWMDNAERRIPVQYAKRVVGRKMYGGQSTHIPIKVNMCGVLPIIFASSILSIPETVKMFITDKVESSTFWTKFFDVFTSEHWAYSVMYFVLILFFAYFYASIQYDPVEMGNNIRKNSGMIPGTRPGKPTSDYIAKILNRIVLLGALLISVVALLPLLFQLFTTMIKSKMVVSLGGTSIIIMVGVALETVKQLESMMMMRHYKGFLD